LKLIEELLKEQQADETLRASPLINAGFYKISYALLQQLLPLLLSTLPLPLLTQRLILTEILRLC
jgi:hypothetical protein